MINIPKTGLIYHVIDKATGEVIKVGSTIQTLRKRFNGWDYKKKYTNHYLKEVRRIESSELDWFELKNLLCPFMWHLVAAETLEIVKQGTFNKSVLSNWRSPLHQKLCGLGGEYGFIGGKISGKINGDLAVKNKTGIHSPDFDRTIPGRVNSPAQLAAKRRNFAIARTPEHQVIAGIAAGKANIESGWAFELGKNQGRKNANSGHCARISHLGASLGAITRNHNQYHTKRGIVSPSCIICREEN